MSGSYILERVNWLSVGTTAAIGGALVATSYLIKSSMRYSGAPPGPKRIPVLGNIEFNAEDGSSFNDELQRVTKKYGPILCVYVGNHPIIIISDYTILREAFVTKGIELAGRPSSAMNLAYNPDFPRVKGIFDADYSDEWKGQRNTALSILRSQGWGKSVIEERIRTESEALLEELIKKEGIPFNPADIIGTSVTNIICSLLFGERFDYSDAEFLELNTAIDDLLNAFANDNGGDYIPIMRLTATYRKAYKDAFTAGNKLVEFYRKKIQEARDRLQSGEEPNDFVTSYMSALESAGSSDSKIKEDWTIQLISDFFLAGAETTTTTLRWAILHMANHQDVQEKVFKEIQSKLKKDHIVSLKDRENLPYTEATIMEIQRIAALAPLAVPHEAMADTTLAGYTVPKGAEIWGNLYGVLRDPKTFPEPEKLKPERFLNDALDSVTRPEQWVPFSMGRRTCLGEQLARQELFIFFTNIFKTFKILPAEGVDNIEFKEIFKFVLKPSDYEVRFMRR